MTREHRPERFAQLTYTSSDGRDRPGGWGVQDVAGTLDAPERAALTRRIVPRFVPVPGLPAYPAPEQLAARPARVVHAPAGPGTAYWHTVACGTDAHGRPGNVFVHVLLDRGPPATEATGSPVRPADLAASGSWLRPFGHAEVATTALRTVPAPPWTAEPGRAAVLDFLFAEGGAGIATLCLLLDALDAALRGGRPVVLGPAAMDRAPLWIAAADHLMSLGAARRCGWSTYERVPHAGEWPADLHLVAVPAADLAAMSAGSAPSATVLDEDEEVPRADLGDAPRTTRHGEQVAVTPWSVMAFVVLAERAGAEALLSRMDAAGAAVPEATHPAWAMAMAIAQAPDLAPDAVPAACAVLSSTTPPSVAVRHPALYDDVLALVSRFVGPGAGGPVAALPAATGARRAILRDLALLRAIDDLDALDHLAGLGTDALGEPDPGRPVAARVRERGAALAGDLLAPLDTLGTTDRCDAVGRAAAVVDLLAAVGVDLRAEPALTAGWDHVAAVLLDDPDGPAVAERLGDPAGSAARAGIDDAVRRRLHRDPRAPGTRVPAAVLRLLGVHLPRASDLVAHGGADELQRELAALLVLADPDPAGAAWVVRVWDLLGGHGGHGAHGGHRDGPDLTRLIRAADGETGGPEPARARDLAALLGHREHPALHRPALRSLLAAGDDEHLDALVEVVLAPRAAGAERPRRLTDAARLRRLVADPRASGRDELLGLAGSLLPAVPPAAVARAIWRAVLTALVTEATVRAWNASDPFRGASGAGWAGADRTPEIVRRGAVAVAVRPHHRGPGGAGAGEADPVVTAALSAAPEFDGPPLAHAALAVLLGDTWPATAGLRALADVADPGAPGGLSALLLAVARRRYRGGGLEEADREAAMRRLRRDRRGPSLGRRRHQDGGEDPEVLALRWWSEVVSEESERSGPAGAGGAGGAGRAGRAGGAGTAGGVGDEQGPGPVPARG